MVMGRGSEGQEERGEDESVHHVDYRLCLTFITDVPKTERYLEA